MIAVDTSSLRRFFSGERGPDVNAVAGAIEQRSMVLPPVVLTEMLSDPSLPQPVIAALSAMPILEIVEGFWIRAGVMRSRVIASGHKAKVADALIAQSCLDHDTALVTHDRDFRHYTRFGLRLT